jgi:hypothetical protein
MLSVAAMLTIAPVLAVTTLICWDPARWGGSVDPLNILMMSLFGLITVALWPTYIPAIILTPLLMRQAATHRAFMSLPIPLLLGLSSLTGAAAGMCVLGWPILLSLTFSFELALNWAVAGAVSGATTATLICLLYRCAPGGGRQDP